MFPKNEILLYRAIVRKIIKCYYDRNEIGIKKEINSKLHRWILRNLDNEDIDEKVKYLNDLKMGITLKVKNDFIQIYYGTENNYCDLGEVTLNK